jgi:RNA polymerase sigma-70 factor (ECF subfamily)
MREAPADIALLACVLNGDESGLAALLERHWHSLVKYSFSILDDSDAAEDVAEEVFVRLWEHREKLGLEGSVLGLLFRMARNLSLDEHRHVEAHQRAARQAPEPMAVPTPAEYVEGAEFQSAVTAAVANLPERRREVFELVRQHGLSYRETADALGLAPQTVANHFTMALSDLREALGPLLRQQRDDSAWRETRDPYHVAGKAVGQ